MDGSSNTKRSKKKELKMKYATVMETKAVLGKFMLATGVAIAALSAQGLDQAPIVKAKTAETKTAEGRLNTLPWNATINGVTLPAPAGRTKVCEYKVKGDAVTIRIDGKDSVVSVPMRFTE